MNSNPQTKKIKIIKKTATVEPPTTTVEPQTSSVEPQTARPLADIYEDYTYFCCMLEAKHNDKGVLKKYPKMPVDWQNTEVSKFDNTKNALAIITGKKSNITVIDYDDKEKFEIDKALYPELLNHYVKNNKGYHCYFKFNDKIPSTVTDGVDFQNDKKCVFAPPTKYYDENKKEYKYIHMATNELLDMSMNFSSI